MSKENARGMQDDAISRQVVLNEFCHSCDGWSCNPNTCCKTEWIRKLPPIQPKRGRWIGKYPVTSVCSECGFLIHDSKVKAFAYCPNCGADMREVNNESN